MQTDSEVQDPAGNRVIGIDLETFVHVPRAVGIAGGHRKYAAILGALRGKRINILITDQFTGRLAETSQSPKAPRGSAQTLAAHRKGSGQLLRRSSFPVVEAVVPTACLSGP